MLDLLFRTRVPVRVEEEHMLVERPVFKFIDPRLVDELRSVDSHHSHYASFRNWLPILDVNFLLNAIVIFISDLVHPGMAGDKLDKQFFTKPVLELQSGWLIEFVGKAEVTLSYESLLVYLEVVDPSLLFSLNDLISTVRES